MNETFKSLTSLIKQHKVIIVMTHKNIDLDGFGSAICLYEIIKDFKKECHICLNRYKLSQQIIKSIDYLEKENINIVFTNKTEISDLINDETLLIIIDTYKKEMLEEEKIIDVAKNVVILDHHIVNNADIIDTKLTYINSSISSINEIMVNYLKYLNKQIPPLVATIMLAGIEIDTNSFKLKTTEKTYEAAAYLTTLGASNIVKQEILKEAKEDYLKRQKYIRKSYTINENIALCIMDENIFDKKELATIAESLLQFEKIEASYVIGNIGPNEVGISARSLGNIDVFKVCKKLGGGGHLTNAAVQFADKTIPEVKKLLLDIIK